MKKQNILDKNYIKNLLNWRLFLVLLSILLFIVNIAIFYPGFMSPDSINQLCQAMSVCDLNGWHPISMALTWRLLLGLFGNPASLLIFQLLLLWTSLSLFSLYVWKITKNEWLSLLPLLIGLMPNILNISGVIWKDVHMAFALLLASVLAIVGSKVIHKNLRVILYIASVLLVFYAVSVRVNGVAAAIPIFILIAYNTGWFKSKLHIACVVVLLVGVSLSITPTLNKVFNVQKGDSTVTMKLLDIVNIRTPNQLDDAPEKLHSILAELSDCSHFGSSGAVNLRLWQCTDISYHFSDDQTLVQLNNYWIKVIQQRPVAYILHKIETYALFIFPGNDQYIWQNGISDIAGSGLETTYSPSVKYISLLSLNSTYTNNFGYMYFPFIYKAWFWLAVAVMLIVVSRKSVKYKSSILLLALSAALNILSFAIGSITSDYRFIYWSVLACLVASVLMMMDVSHNRMHRKSL